MLSTSTRLRLKDILQRIASGKEVSLEERIYVDKFADKNQTIASCLRRANRLQQKQEVTNGIDHLLNDLDLIVSDPHSSYHPKIDDIGEWFGGAPSWLVRS